MATEINIDGTLILDQSSGLHDDDVAIAGDLSPLSQDFIDFLDNLAAVDANALSADQLAFADDVEAVVSGANFVTVSQNDAAITNLFFSDGDGNALDGDQVFLDPGIDSDPLQTVDGDDVYLWSFGDVVIATTSNDPLDKGDVVAAFYLNEADDHLSASIEYVTFVPFAHDDVTDHDDTFDWTNILNISASGSLSFGFDELDSGNFLHVTVGTEDAGLLISGLEPVIKPDGSINKQASESVNTSQGGTGATVGIDNQMFVPGNIGVFSFVVGQVPGTYTDIADLDYDDFLDVKDGGIFISQVQGNPTTNFTLKISAFSAGGGGTDPEDGVSYIDNDLGSGDNLGLDASDSALKDDTPAPILRVVVRDDTKAIVTDTTIDDAHVTFNGDGSVTVEGLDAEWTVEWFVDDPATLGFETFNRFHLEAIEGKFDVGRVFTSEGITITEPVGDKLFVDDDGPSTSANATVALDDDTLTNGIPGGVGDDNPDTANTAGTLGHSFGTDEAGTIEWLTTGAPAGFDYVKSGDDLLIKQDGTTVITLTLDTATGAYTATQNNPIVHAAGDDENNQPFTVNYRVTDGDGDTADGTLSIDADDDTPNAAVERTGTAVLHDETPGVDAGSDDEALPAPGIFPAGAIGWAQSAGAVIQPAAGDGFGADGPAAAGSVVHSLAIPADGTDSGLKAIIDPVTGETREISLFEGAGGIIVGRIDNPDNSANNAGTIAIAIAIDSTTGVLSMAQYLPMLHLDGLGDHVDVVSMTNSALQVVRTITDKDFDSSSHSVDIGDRVQVRDDDLDSDAADLGGVQEDDLNNALSVGLNEDGSLNAHTRTDNLEPFIDASIDRPLTFSLKDGSAAALAAANAGLESKGEAIVFDVNVGASTVTLFVDNTDSNDGVLGADDRLVATWTLTAAGLATLTVLDQFDHATAEVGRDESDAGDDGQEETTNVNFSDAIAVFDRDLSTVVLPADFVQYSVEDDMPDIGDSGANGVAAGEEDEIVSVAIDFAAPGTVGEVTSKTQSLEAVLGTDEGVNPAIAGSGGVTIEAFDAQIVYADNGITLTGVRSGDKKMVQYFDDANGNGGLDAGEDEYFRLTINDTDADSTNWTYTWESFQAPPPAEISLDFSALAATKFLYGVVGETDQALLVIGRDPAIKADGTPVKGGGAGDLINTSKGGGETTIGVNNQHFTGDSDSGTADQGAYFTYITSGHAAGTFNDADDIDAVTDITAISSASLQVSQTQAAGSQPVAMKVTTLLYDEDDFADGMEFVSDLEPGDHGDNVNLLEIKVLDDQPDGNGDPIVLVHFTYDPDEDIATQVELADGYSVDFVSDNEVVIGGLQQKDTVLWVTEGDHSRVLVEALAGKFDIGKFSFEEGQPTEDKVLDWEVKITDFDGDMDSATFQTGIDGTGDFDDDFVDPIGAV